MNLEEHIAHADLENSYDICTRIPRNKLWQDLIMLNINPRMLIII